MAAMDAASGEGGLKHSDLLRAVDDSASVRAAVLKTSQQFDDLLKAVDAALRAKQIVAADILRNIGERRDEFVMECMPQALNLVREVQSFGIEFEGAIKVITQRLQDPHSSDSKGRFRNLGRDVDAIMGQAQTLEDALRDLQGRLKGDDRDLASAMKSDPNPDLWKMAIAAVVGGGLVVGAALTGGATYIVAAGVFRVAAGKALLGAAGVGVCTGLLGGGAVSWYCKSVNDAKAKLFNIQEQMQYVMSAVADLVNRWKQIKASVSEWNEIWDRKCAERTL